MKVLIFGDGLLGKELADKTGWDVVSRKTTGLDITDYDSIDNLVSKYDTIVNCIANTDTYSEDRIEHMKVNYEFVAILADINFNREYSVPILKVNNTRQAMSKIAANFFQKCHNFIW